MNTNTWNDFNDAEQQQSFDLIPKGTIVKVRMTIKPGGHDDAAQCRADISDEMTAREIAEAQRRARQWLGATIRKAA